MSLSVPFYTNKQPADERKLRGGYYTPNELAHYLIKWGIREDTKRILEPSCGDGNFIVETLEHIQKLVRNNNKIPEEITAVELNPKELKKAKERSELIGKNGTRIDWIHQDFFKAYSSLAREDKFDLVIGNPPFIRFQYFNDDSRALAFKHLEEAGYKTTKLANCWVAFVELSIELIRNGGRLAMVVPAELLQVNYANQLRQRLTSQFEQIIIIGFEKLVFPEIQQEIFLLLADGKHELSNTPSDIYTIELYDGIQLQYLNNLSDFVAHIPAKHSRNGMKWTSLFIEESAYKALDEAQKCSRLLPLGSLASVDVGIVTGRNSFFILNEFKRNQLQASSLSIPIVGRTSAFTTPVFNQIDFENYKNIYPSYLLDLSGVFLPKFPLIMDYIKLGEKEGINLGYKCRIRKRWFDVPSIYTPNAFLFRQIHRYPLLVVNKAQATCSDTIHRVRVKNWVDITKLACIFFNSLTLAWAEVCGRSYGGGVLELEPREAEELPIAYSDSIGIDIDKVVSLIKKGSVYEALDYVDNVVLKDFLGFDHLIMREIRKAWEQLRDRRNERRHNLTYEKQ